MCYYSECLVVFRSLNGRVALSGGYMLYFILSPRAEFGASLELCLQRPSGPELDSRIVGLLSLLLLSTDMRLTAPP